MRTRRLTQGTIVLELLIATALFAIVLSGIIVVAFGGQTSALDVGLTNEGLSRAGTAMASSSSAAAGNWGTFTAGTSTAGSDATYAMLHAVTDISPCAKLVADSSGWNSEHNRTQGELLQNIVVNTTIARLMGGGCSATPPSLWDNPAITDQVPNINGQGTGVAARYINGIRYAFVTTSGAASAKDLWVLNTTDINPPTLTTSLEVNTLGLNDIAVAGTYAYVVSGDTAAQFIVIDISNPTAPSIVATKPLQNAPDGIGRVIYYYNDMIYIGTGYTPPCHGHGCVPPPDPEFQVFDVSTPTNPVPKGTYELDQDVNDIVVRGNYAYLATSDDNGELTILDVSDPGSISLVKKFNLTGTEDALSLFVLGDYAYLGRDKSSAGEFYVIDISNPSNPVIKDSEKLITQSSGGINAIYVQGSLAFIGTRGSTNEFQIWDISDPTNVHNHPLCVVPNYSQAATDIDYLDDLVFIANRTLDQIRIAYDPPSVCVP